MKKKKQKVDLLGYNKWQSFRETSLNLNVVWVKNKSIDFRKR